ncbi:MAG: ABC transporter ATP-binding protein [Deltaproteobacteria bacterium]|nr:ABC transporter ATP-binding protein [Deltaproteobacteria bacterium]
MESSDLGQKIKLMFRLNRAVRFVWQAGPGLTLVGLILLLLRGLLPLLTLYLMKLIVDAVTLALSAPDKTAALREVGLLIGIAAGVAILNTLLQLAADLVREYQSGAVTDHMYNILHAKSIQVDLQYYENPQYLDTLHRAQQEGPARPTMVLDGLVRVGQSGISLVAVSALLLSFHWSMALVLFAAALPGVLVRLGYSRKVFRWQRERTPAERRANYLNWILTVHTHAKEIRLFDQGRIFMERFRDLRRRLRLERLEIVKKRAIKDLAVQTGGTLVVFGSFAFIAYRAIQGTITLGDMVMYFQAFQRGLGFFRGMLGGMAQLYEDNLFLSNLYEFLDLGTKVNDPPHPLPVPRPLKKGLVFDRVSFRYPAGKRMVLREISLALAPGEVVALVGENGSGKSTLVKLLCRLYDPLKGSITLDGMDLREFDRKALRREISVIFQDYAQYHMTARENIWFGNIDSPTEDKRIEEAALCAGAHEPISQLPKGYETILGKWFEDGEELSIGEWQKVALARAFFRKAQIIVLDEPTSAMDAMSEYKILKRFHQLLEGRSAILISHRFSTVRNADRIFVFKNGTIIENGSHERLIQLGGEYARLFEKQAQHYR